MAVKKETAEERQARKGAELMGKATNKDKREAIAYLGKGFDEFDAFDNVVFIAWIADKSKSLEDYDNMPMTELEALIQKVLDSE